MQQITELSFSVHAYNPLQKQLDDIHWNWWSYNLYNGFSIELDISPTFRICKGHAVYDWKLYTTNQRTR